MLLSDAQHAALTPAPPAGCLCSWPARVRESSSCCGRCAFLWCTICCLAAAMTIAHAVGIARRQLGVRPVSVSQQLQGLDLIPHMLWHQGLPVTRGRSAQSTGFQHPAWLSQHPEMQLAELRTSTGDGTGDRLSQISVHVSDFWSGWLLQPTVLPCKAGFPSPALYWIMSCGSYGQARFGDTWEQVWGKHFAAWSLPKWNRLMYATAVDMRQRTWWTLWRAWRCRPGRAAPWSNPQQEQWCRAHRCSRIASGLMAPPATVQGFVGFKAQCRQVMGCISWWQHGWGPMKRMMPSAAAVELRQQEAPGIDTFKPCNASGCMPERQVRGQHTCTFSAVVTLPVLASKVG